MRGFQSNHLLMRILCGHPTGNPNSHHAALAHFEAGRLEAFCVPWMPSSTTLRLLSMIPKLGNQVSRLARRRFAPLDDAPKIQEPLGEIRRLLLRSRTKDPEGLSYEANDWLMRTMKRECSRKSVTAVHSYEDCSLWQFEEAKRLGKMCIYEMPIGYYSAWEQTIAELARKYADWLPPGGVPSSQWVRPEQKRREMELADRVLAPSSFVKETILRFHPDKKVDLALYGVDSDFWKPASSSPPSSTSGPLRFIYAGHSSVRKGTPSLLDAWTKADLKDAQLDLVGLWQLAPEKRKKLPANVILIDPVSPDKLREYYRAADVFVFPSYFEGFGLVVLEAMACGLTILATEATAGPDVLTDQSGRIIPTGDEDALVESLRWFSKNRDCLPAMKASARARAKTYSWDNYRKSLNEIMAKLA
jgi:glycosyltransferase involved in cell wall biosynthesis